MRRVGISEFGVRGLASVGFRAEEESRAQRRTRSRPPRGASEDAAEAPPILVGGAIAATACMGLPPGTSASEMQGRLWLSSSPRIKDSRLDAMHALAEHPMTPAVVPRATSKCLFWAGF